MNITNIFVQALISGVISAIEAALGRTAAPPPAAGAAAPDIPALLAFQPQSPDEALDHLHKLHAALQTVNPADAGTIGKILAAIGAIVLAFFPQYAQEAQFLIAIGTALEQGGGTGSVGPIRLGNLGFTLAWAPWASG